MSVTQLGFKHQLSDRHSGSTVTILTELHFTTSSYSDDMVGVSVGAPSKLPFSFDQKLDGIEDDERQTDMSDVELWNTPHC